MSARHHKLTSSIHYWWRRADGKPMSEAEEEGLHESTIGRISFLLSHGYREGELQRSSEHNNVVTEYSGWWSIAPGTLPGYFFAVSNDGGKTCVACRENIADAMSYLEAQNSGGLTDYAVVVVKGKIE